MLREPRKDAPANRFLRREPLPTTPASLQSITRLCFGPEGVLFIADWKASQILAVELRPSTAPANEDYFNLHDLWDTLDIAPEDGPVVLEDIAMRPGSAEAYVGVSVGTAKEPRVYMVQADGTAQRVLVDKLPCSCVALDSPPNEDEMFWGTIPRRSYTVTCMVFHDGTLYAAGLSNQNFASTLRAFDFPFTGECVFAQVEMYHVDHRQIETRAPIRAMSVLDLGGKPHLLAGYLCVPIVTIPLDAITDGARIQAQTIAELGSGGYPIAVLPVSFTNPVTKQTVERVVFINHYRPSFAVDRSVIEAAHAAEPLCSPMPMNQMWKFAGDETGEGIEVINIATVYRMVHQGERLLAARRDLADGRVELVTYPPGVIRLTDMIIEEYWWESWTPVTDFDRLIIQQVSTSSHQEGRANVFERFKGMLQEPPGTAPPMMTDAR